MHHVLRPNYRRAREIKAEMEVLMRAEDYDSVDSLKAELHDLQAELFRTGVTSEYDL